MELEIDGETVSLQPTSAQIVETVETLKERKDSFAVLSKDTMSYIQTSINPKTGFILEYQDGSVESHYRSVEFNLSPKVVSDVLVSYLASDNRWRKSIAWEKVDLNTFDMDKLERIVCIVAAIIAGFVLLYWWLHG